MKPAFDPKHGTITAGNASAVSDGAAGMLVMSAEKARALGKQPMARVVSMSAVGVDPLDHGLRSRAGREEGARAGRR